VQSPGNIAAAGDHWRIVGARTRQESEGVMRGETKAPLTSETRQKSPEIEGAPCLHCSIKKAYPRKRKT